MSSDREILRHFTAVIAHPDFDGPVVRTFVEPVWKAAFAALRALVRW